MQRKLTLVILLVLLLNACGIPVPKDKSDYVGQWYGNSMTLNISADGSVDYERVKNGTTTSINAPIKQFEGDNFVVGIGAMTTTFEVAELPNLVGGEWQMVVDGERLTKANH